MSFSQVELVVNGDKVQVDLEEILSIQDISRDMDQVASQMSYWGAVWAAADEESQRADAHYRKWRAETGQRILSANEKTAEWKVKQDIESDETFLKLKSSLAQAAHNVTLAKAIFEAFKIKANMLQSKGAMARAELDSTGMATKVEAPKRSSGEDEERKLREKEEIVKRALKNKKK